MELSVTEVRLWVQMSSCWYGGQIVQKSGSLCNGQEFSIGVRLSIRRSGCLCLEFHTSE